MISSDNYVVVQREKSFRVLKVAKGHFLIDKLKFHFDNAIGHPYGTNFVVKNHQLERIEEDRTLTTITDVDSNFDSVETSAIDVDQPTKESLESTNGAESVVDNNADDVVVQQKITREELYQMKKDGTLSANEIVSKLVEGCNTFKQKSSYAQEKYVAKKNKKHSNVIRLFKPTIRLLNEIYYRKDCEKISYLRIDNLSLLLSMANVHYGSKTIVVENCGGLITAAVLERLGGDGICLNLHKGDQQQSAPCLVAMNFSKEIMATFYPVPLNTLMNGDDDTNGAISNPIGEETDEKLERKERKRKSLQILRDERFDSIIVACKYHPLELFKKLYPKLESSRQFVFYSPYVQVKRKKFFFKFFFRFRSFLCNF